jgi:LuxR family transcriptional regulator, maltose regulon positive regulatory protein
MRRTRAKTGRTPAAEGQIGRTAPPIFMFEPVRTRALELFDKADGLAPKVLSIVAPVGYGKTVLMSSLLAEARHSGRACIWFALDDRDLSVDTVINHLEALLDGGTSAMHPTQALFRGAEPIAQRIEALIDLINRRTQPLTIYIDNLHFCTDPALGLLLDKLSFTTHPFVHLVLSSIRESPLDLSRAQMQGLLQQIGPTALSFSQTEIAELLGPALCDCLGEGGVQTLAQRTEGWPAAVRLARIILSGADDPRAALKDFSGSDEALAPLLNRQVLQGFPAHVREYLLQVALLRTFSRELCAFAIGTAEGPDPLQHLIERNVFMIPLDRNGQWYRLHGLFRDFLLREAERTLSVVRRQAVLSRAAQWCDRHGDGASAIEYALASTDVAAAREILERLAPVVVRDRGNVLQYIEWIEALHARGQPAGPEAEYWYAWALTFYRRYESARQHIHKLAERVGSAGPAPSGSGDVDLQRRIHILRASIDSLCDRLEDAHRGAALWLAGAEPGTDDPFNLAAAHCIESGYFASAHRFVEARGSGLAAREAAFQARSAYVDGWVNMYAALTLIYEGDPAAAWPGLNEAMAAARAGLGPESAVCGTIALMAAHCAVEMGRHDEARSLLSSGLASSRTHGFLEAAACGLEAAVRLWTDAPGDPASMSALRDIASAYAPRLSLMLSCFVVQRLVTLGRLDQARSEAEHMGLGVATADHSRAQPPGRTIHLEALLESTRIRLMVSTGQFKPAQALLDDQVRRAKAPHCATRQVELALASASLASRTGEQAQAVRHVTWAINLAAKRGLVRPFTDHADTLTAVVGDTKVGAWGFAQAAERSFFLERCSALRFEDPDLSERLGLLLEGEAQPAAPLTSREMELLAFIEAGLSNQQMADRMNVSLTTVKWHLRNLYGKLGVASRSAALARARVMKLLQR